jgi:hypothetical protein
LPSHSVFIGSLSRIPTIHNPSPYFIRFDLSKYFGFSLGILAARNRFCSFGNFIAGMRGVFLLFFDMVVAFAKCTNDLVYLRQSGVAQVLKLGRHCRKRRPD